MKPLPIGECYDKAKEIVEILKIWDINHADARLIASYMNKIILGTSIEDWKNPMAGTGLVVPGNPNWNEELISGKKPKLT